MTTDIMGEKVVYIYANDGQVLTFLLDENIVVSFDSDNIVVDTSDKKLLFSLFDYLKFEFGDNPRKTRNIETNIKTVNDVLFRFDGNIVIIDNLPSRSLVRFYSSSGILLSSKHANDNGSLQFDLGKYLNQVVIVHTINKSFKICR